MLDPRRWLDIPAVLEKHGGMTVVRDDLIEGGTKLRFLPFLTQGAQEIVYGSPFCGGAAVALSVLGRESGQKISIFYAKRKELSPRQEHVLSNGAQISQVPFGYMTNVQAKARAYAVRHGALFLPLGFDLLQASEPFIEAIRRVRKKTGSPDQVWCATGSGMLARCLAEGFPESEIRAVAVGLASKHGKQAFPSNVTLLESPLPFSSRCHASTPFPCCAFYDRKAWMISQRDRKGSAIFWNVMSDDL